MNATVVFSQMLSFVNDRQIARVHAKYRLGQQRENTIPTRSLSIVRSTTVVAKLAKSFGGTTIQNIALGSSGKIPYQHVA
jgi:hypothetical protein